MAQKIAFLMVKVDSDSIVNIRKAADRIQEIEKVIGCTTRIDVISSRTITPEHLEKCGKPVIHFPLTGDINE